MRRKILTQNGKRALIFKNEVLLSKKNNTATEFNKIHENTLVLSKIAFSLLLCNILLNNLNQLIYKLINATELRNLIFLVVLLAVIQL